MTGQQLKNSILQMAIQGKLVPQDPHDEPASVLLERIRIEKKRLVKEGVLKKKDLEETPISEEEKPFDIPDSWEWCRLYCASYIIGGFAFKSHEYSFEGNRVIRISDISDKGFINKNIVRYPYNSKLSQYVIKERDILMAMTGGTVGKSLLVKELPEENMLLNQRVAIIRANKVLSDFIDIVLKSNYIQYIIANSKNSTNDNISMNDIFNFLVPLPPLAEQHRIVEKLESLMPLIESYGKSQEALNALNTSLPEKLRQSLLQEAIQGHLVPQDPNEEPASLLLERIRAEKARLVKEGKLKKKDLEEKPISPDEIPFDIPEGWVWCRFNSLVNFEMGATPERRNDEYWVSGNHPWISISDMKDLQTIDNSKERITDAALQKYFGNRCSPKGTLIMSFKLTIGRVSILGMDATHNEAIISIYPYVDKNNSLRDYLLHFLRLLTSYIQTTNAIKGSTLNSSKMSQMLIPLPPLSEQRRIVTKLEELLQEIDKLKA